MHVCIVAAFIYFTNTLNLPITIRVQVTMAEDKPSGENETAQHYCGPISRFYCGPQS
jgi:hypothetical protein